MKFIVIGLGSMGKRRIRCLKAIGYSESDILGFDLRQDRRREVEEIYNVKAVADLPDLSAFDAVIISTPPDKHTQYAKIAIDSDKPSFIEASVVIEHVKELQRYNTKQILVAPSCTLRFNSFIKDIIRIIKSKKYGKVTNFSYHSGQYLPDWHPWENIKDYYVSNRITGAAREIVPFELTWIVEAIGFPKSAKGLFRKTIALDADIEDTYSCVLEFENAVGSLVVDVVSRYATRNLIINLEQAQIRWNWDDGYFKIYDIAKNQWEKYEQEKPKTVEGYNQNIDEKMYIEEIAAFIGAVKKETIFPHSIAEDIKVMEIMEKIEKSDGGFNR